jgi:hypothetical protein
MKKIIHKLTFCLALLSSTTQAAKEMNTVEDVSMAIAVGHCSTAFQSVTNGMNDVPMYSANRVLLHACEYIQEMTFSGCMGSGTCLSYQAWSAQVPGLSVSVPDDVFFKNLYNRRKQPQRK